MIFALAVLQISASKDVYHFTLVPWYLEIRRVLHFQKLSTTVNVTYHVTRLILVRLTLRWDTSTPGMVGTTPLPVLSYMPLRSEADI